MKGYWRYRAFALIYMLSDYAAIILAQELALSIRINLLGDLLGILPLKWTVPAVYEYLVIPMVFVFFCYAEKLYSRRQLFWEMSAHVFRAAVYSCFVWLLLFFVTQDVVQLSRPYFILLWLVALPVVLLLRFAAKKLMLALSLWQMNTLLIGSGAAAARFTAAAARDSGMGYRITGRLAEENIGCYESPGSIPLLGSMKDIAAVLRNGNFNEVVIAAGDIPPDETARLIYVAQQHVRSISFVPDSIGIPVMGMETVTIVNEKIVMLKIRNNLAEKFNRLQKQLLDIIFSSFGLLLFVPLFAMIAVLIYLDSPGNILFSHERIGKNGRRFNCYKFRTMQPDAAQLLKKYLSENPYAAAEWERDYKLKDDPRVTRIGKILRRTSLDELPQFLNVLKGDMSLVGPRPIVEAEVAKYGEYIADFYLVRPGITGWWQVYGRNDVSYEERVQMDSWYVRNWSFWLDIELVVKTLSVVLRCRGAY